MQSFYSRKSHYKDKTVLGQFILHDRRILRFYLTSLDNPIVEMKWF